MACLWESLYKDVIMSKKDRYKILISDLVSEGVVNSQKDFGEKLGINNESYFSQIINGKIPEPTNFSNRLKNFIPTLNLSWLENGEGEMLREETNGQNNEKMKELPLIPFGAVAGFPTSDNAGIALKDCPLYSVPDFVALGADYLVRVIGDSMIPRYNQGDLLAMPE